MSILRRIIAALTARRCQTCGKAVETYCRECEDAQRGGYGPDD